MEEIKKYIERKFRVDERMFIEALEKSPGAEGCVHGAIGELFFREYAEGLGFEVLRIKEKPEGGDNAKSAEARGDFYIRKNGSIKDEWLVVECKGLKSNAEKRLNLTIRKSLLTFLKKYSLDRDKKIASNLISGKKCYDIKKSQWEQNNIGKNFPDFNWNVTNPGAGFPDLTHLWKDLEDLSEWLKTFSEENFTENAYWNLTAPIRVLQTHMPSTRIDPVTNIKKTGPLVTEFNILCVDLFLKTGRHEFVFANSEQLNHQGESPNHLQQNYTIDILTAKDNFQRHKLLQPWYDELEKCIEDTKPKHRKLDASQLDNR